MAILALFLIVTLIGLIWIVIVPYETGEPPPPIEQPQPRDFALQLARDAERHRLDASRASASRRLSASH
jgi:hypothetical protein